MKQALKNPNKKKIWINTLFSISTFIILLIFITNLFIVLGWLVKIPITKLHFPLAVIISFIVNYLIQKKYRDTTLKEYLFTIIFGIIIIGFSLLISNLFFDISFDGGWYHSDAIVRLKNGWNPIYELINNGMFSDVYNDCYASKSVWGFSAAVYSFTGFINSTKIMSTLLAIGVSCFSISIFGKITKNKIQLIAIILISLLIGFNPIYLSQMYTNYLDSSLGLLSIFYILLFMAKELKQMDFKDRPFQILCSLLIAIMMNIKLTGLFFAAVFFLLFVIKDFYKILKQKDSKAFLRIFFTGFIGVMLGLFLGINPYLTNVIRGHNIFHPIFGSEKIEVMGANVPEALRDKTNIEKIIFANFSKSAIGTKLEETVFKSPLNISLMEYKGMNQDTRVGSFGAAFALLLTISSLVTIIYSKQLFMKEKNEELNTIKKALWKTIIIILIIAVIFPEAWWGRYYVPLFIIPLLIAIYLIFQSSKIKQTIAIIIILINVGNSLLVEGGLLKYNVENSTPMTEYLQTIKGKHVYYNCYDPGFHKWERAFGAYFEEFDVHGIPNYDKLEYDFIGGKTSIKVID
ncbi:MAG: hypothetical protein RSE91_03315 [Bacilli bacterium]